MGNHYPGFLRHSAVQRQQLPGSPFDLSKNDLAHCARVILSNKLGSNIGGMMHVRSAHFERSNPGN
jgi:hypothetical protein